MKLQEIMNQITTLGGQIRAASGELAKIALDKTVPLDEIEKKKADIADMQKRMDALQASYDSEKAGTENRLNPIKPEEKKEEKKTMNEIRKSNEYARAFAYAMKHGLNARNGMGNEKVKILYDALTEEGGTPAGTDGGFLVPEDMDHQIRELKRQLNPLSALFNVETVNSFTGWRVIDTAPTAGMTLVNEMGTIPTDDQPAFVKVPFTLDKYALRLPVSNELLSDEVAGLMAYLSRWFARKQVLTENALLIAALKTLTASSIVPSGTGKTAIDGFKTALNKALDPAISLSSAIICSQSAFDAIDQIVDDQGRGLLQPNPANATEMRILGRPVYVVSDAYLPNGTGTGTPAEIFIGDGHEFATLFQKDGFEIASTDIGGNAWATDSTEIRGISRMCVSKFDAAAMVRRNIAL